MGELDEVVNVMAHVGERYDSRLVYDPLNPGMDHNIFKECDWSEFYGDAKEAIPVNVTKPQDKEVDIEMFVDGDHAGDKESCRSRTSFFIHKHTIGTVILKKTV